VKENSPHRIRRSSGSVFGEDGRTRTYFRAETPDRIQPGESALLGHVQRYPVGRSTGLAWGGGGWRFEVSEEPRKVDHVEQRPFANASGVRSLERDPLLWTVVGTFLVHRKTKTTLVGSYSWPLTADEAAIFLIVARRPTRNAFVSRRADEVERHAARRPGAELLSVSPRTQAMLPGVSLTEHGREGYRDS